MKSQDHKAATDDGKVQARPRIKTSSQVVHPILQLQQLVGNKAVTKMIQREKGRQPGLEVSNDNTSIVQRESEGKDYSQDIKNLYLRGDVFQSRSLKNRDIVNQHATVINAINAALVAHKKGGGHKI